MAFAKEILPVFLMLVSLVQVSLGAVHNVGDSAGWTIMGNVDYSKWASSKNFHVGDSLLFQYNSQFHNVKQVTHQDFQSCNATSPVATYTSGSDSVTLKRTGHYYFLCGVPGHCQAGQKLDVLITPPTLRPTASPAPLLGKPIDSVAPSPAQSGAPSHYMPQLLLAISVAFYVFILA